MIPVKVDCLAHDRGSIVTFYGTIEETGELIEFVCDSRMSGDIVTALQNLESNVVAYIEKWQIRFGSNYL